MPIAPELHTRAAMTCANCHSDLPTDRYQIHLTTNEVVELDLCEGCRHKFVTADWVDAVV